MWISVLAEVIGIISGSPGSKVGPPTTAAIAEAQRIITAAGASDLFAEASIGPYPAARHLSSGLICQFEPGSAANRIIIYPGNLPRGDDVGCETGRGDMVINYSATRYAAPITEGQAMSDAIADLQMQVSGLTPNRARVEVPPERETPSSHTVRFLGQLGNRKVFARISVAKVKGWIVVQRMTAKFESDNATGIGSDLTADGGWRLLLDRMVGVRSKSEPGSVILGREPP